ncbi:MULTISPECIES: K+/H+ antiporter subunit F [Stutzerimonas]|jgi:multicomponent K+:H+ antiporter subunit F|uniref:Cation:proton antiporter n=2 Tax=Stutzerimonas balearica TaxID=74829 RepID=A0A8D3Y273_9GAMM|nr:K+/H+ antiporter subunit F [Stutzerimonas balearica]KIL06510.1 cation:proton antiporter [Stutzerimonas stutzeri]MBB60475.1 K+/H+ antiporter subunit F [Pseudomonas sp.]MBZ5756838.1 K+/H+ antiporter subunit F [Pseudomonas sp. S5(2021)]WIX01548.1 K+/H+ antiporter subunit F [Pseudomonas sp. AR5]AJE15911.1 cation:proton antiporter [Stutzerimonas balearica DSM 6083]|tara:strand:+ start:135 stop:404 length:270 start_codon:yes stop_codon:yes gene_type:complete
MLAYVIPLCFVLLSIAVVLNMLRLIQGPDMPDRILALDTLYINGLALIILFGVWLASDIFFEAALLIAVMGFVSTVAVAKHLLHGDIID